MKISDESSRPLRPSDVEAIEATAAAWLAHRDDGFSSEEAQRFNAWRAAESRHEEAVTRLERVWSSLQTLREFRPTAERHPDCDLLHHPTRRLVPAFIVAGVACLVAVAAWVHQSRSASTGQVYATTAGGYQRVTLADGSLTELNSATQLAVTFSRMDRRVQLTRGEAHFIVAKDSRRPFVVEANGVTVRALGTAFNLRVGSAQVEVLVTEGRVSVAREAAAVAEVAANERVVVPSTGTMHPARLPVVERMDAAAVREALAWQGLRISFQDTPLSEAVRQFNLRNVVQIELSDAEIGGLPIGGSFRVDNVDGFVRLLENGGEIVASRPDATRIVLQRAK